VPSGLYAKLCHAFLVDIELIANSTGRQQLVASNGLGCIRAPVSRFVSFQGAKKGYLVGEKQYRYE